MNKKNFYVGMDEYYLVDRIYFLIDNGSLEYVKEGEPLPPYDCYIRRK